MNPEPSTDLPYSQHFLITSYLPMKKILLLEDHEHSCKATIEHPLYTNYTDEPRKADDCLTKPFDEIDLLHTIEKQFHETPEEGTEADDKNLMQNEFSQDISAIASLKNLLKGREIKPFKRKEKIYSQGTHPKGVYYLMKGKIKINHMNDMGKVLITELHKEGNFFGYLPLLQNEPYSSSATALEKSDICMVPQCDFFDFIFKNTDVLKELIKLISSTAHENEKKLAMLAYSPVRKRIAEALIKFSVIYQEESNKNLTIKVSREDLANIAGTTTETVIRTLTDFKDEKLIEINTGKIIIPDYTQLLKLKK